MRIVFKPGALENLASSPRVRADITRRAAAIRDACNAESSWGGYESGPESENRRASANVWTIGLGRADNARSNRMVRNLDAGRN